MPSLELRSHGRLHPDPDGWWTLSGHTHVTWIDADGATERPPAVGDIATAIVSAPFATGADGRFAAPWRPPMPAVNGWDLGDDALLSALRLVEAELVEVGGPRTFGWSEGVEIRARIRAVHDPRSFLGTPGVSTDLTGCLLDPGDTFGKTVLADERIVLVHTTLQGDVNFDFHLQRGTSSVVLLVDECIGAGFFYAGHGLVTPAALAALYRPGGGNGAERLAGLRPDGPA